MPPNTDTMADPSNCPQLASTAEGVSTMAAGSVIITVAESWQPLASVTVTI